MSSVEASAPIDQRSSTKLIEKLYLQHRPWLLAFLNRRFGSLVGEDLAQEAFVRTLASGSEMRNPRAFLAKVAIRAALEAAQRRPEVSLAYELETAVEPDAEQALMLEQAILALPAPIRDVFLLSRFGGLSNVEIAKRCNLSVKRVEARLTEARRRCAALMRA
jgi:RNA polymerase sigma factor (sigma-70 family)